jgi:hypothetical protein
VLDLVVALLRRLPADRRLGAGAEALRQLAPDVDLRLRIGNLELLHVGVDRDELHLVDAGVDHAVDGVEPRAPDTDDLDLGQVGAERSRARVMQARRRLRHRLDVADDGRLRNRSRGRIGDGLWLRRLGLRVGRWALGRLDLVLPRGDVLDRRLVRLLRGRALALTFLLALRRLGCLEELRQRALTHARALSRH